MLNANVHPAARLLSRLNEHNVRAGTFGQSRVSDAAYYAVANGGTPYYVEVSADTHAADAAAYLPTAASGNAWKVSDSAEWERIGSMVVSPVTGECVLWLIALVQYAIVDSSLSSSPMNPIQKARVQFAFRVNGSIIDSVIPGLSDVGSAAPRGYWPRRPAAPGGGAPLGPYSIHTFRTPGTSAMMYHVRPVRIMECVPVPAGTHTVELVVRRVPNDKAVSTETANLDPTAPPVYCYNRKLLAVDLHLGPPASSTDDFVEAASVADGDVMSVANLYTNGIAALVSKANALGDGAILRGGLRKEHLPSRVMNPGSTGQDTGQAPFATAYPGWNTVAGWTELADAGAVACRTTFPSVNFTTTPGFVILLGNVRLSDLTAGATNIANNYAFFAIQQRFDSAVTRMNAANEVVVNTPATDASGTGTRFPLETDVPLFAFYDYRTSPPADGAVTYWNVVGSSRCGTGVVGSIDQDGASLQCIMFKP